jgi:hypothetical protein
MRKIKCGECENIITKKHDGQSKKMLQSQMLKSSKSYKLKYSNSANDTLIQDIISNDFEINKGLLLCYKFDRYSEIISPLLLKFPKINILGLLDKIILSLSTDQYNSVFKIKMDVPIIIDHQIIYENKKTFYVVVANLFGYNSFIFKNYTNDVFVPTYSYTFNLEDVSNLNTKLSFSIDKNWIPYTHLTYSVELPGTTGAYVIVSIPQTITSGHLYVYNAKDVNTGTNYILWGYNVSKINILLDSVKEKITPLCANIPPLFVYQQKVVDEKKITETVIKNDFTIICMTRSTILLINNTYGANLYIDDVIKKTGLGFYNNNKYGLYLGIYYIYVPQKFELAFLNKNDSNFIYSNADETKHSTGIIDGDKDVYDFYYGTIKIEIKGSFQPISIYTKKYGYLNCKDIIVYSDTCSSVLEDKPPYLIPY